MHIPKTAGSTLLQVFARQFGERFQRAYRPPTPGLTKTDSDGWPDIADPLCIHGHLVFERFPWVKEVPEARFITFLRDPLAGAISMWRFQRSRTPWNPANPQPVIPADVNEYLLNGYNHNRYGKWFERSGRPFERFVFVGVVEQFHDSMRAMFDALSLPPIWYGHANASEGSPPAIDPAVASEFARLNEADYGLFYRAMDMIRTATPR